VTFRLSKNQKEKISGLNLLNSKTIDQRFSHVSEADLFSTIEHVLKDFNPPSSKKNMTKAKIKSLIQISKDAKRLRTRLAGLESACLNHIDTSISVNFSGTPSSEEVTSSGSPVRNGINRISSLDILQSISDESSAIARSKDRVSEGYLTDVIHSLCRIFPGRILSHSRSSKLVQFLAVILNMNTEAIHDQLKRSTWFEKLKDSRNKCGQSSQK